MGATGPRVEAESFGWLGLSRGKVEGCRMKAGGDNDQDADVRCCREFEGAG